MKRQINRITKLLLITFVTGVIFISCEDSSEEIFNDIEQESEREMSITDDQDESKIIKPH